MLFCQLDYPQELGTGIGYTIAEYGCALTAVASMLINVFQKSVDPITLNEYLNAKDGYVSNGEKGVFDILDWTAITRIFPDVALVINTRYPTSPADMKIIDKYLSQGMGVIVGVSFVHNSQDQTSSHYVELYRKNSDGMYQMRDPMFRGSDCDSIFDTRYAVNGMTVANAILQVVIYTGPVVSPSVSPSQSPSSSESVSISPSVSPSISAEAQPSVIDTPVEEIKATIPVAASIPNVKELPVSSASMNVLKEAVHMLEIERNNAIAKAKIIAERYEDDFKHYTGLVAAGYDTVDKVDKMMVSIKNDLIKHRKQTVEVLKSAEDMARIYAEKCKEDYSQIEAGTTAMKDLEVITKELEAVAVIHNAKPTFNSIASAWDILMTKYAMAKREIKKLQTNEIVTQVASLPVVEKIGATAWIYLIFGVSQKGGKNV